MREALNAHLGRIQYQATLKLLERLSRARHSEVVDADRRHPILTAGTGSKLLLLHGFADSKETWLPLLPILARHHACVAPDLPGYGKAAAIPPNQANLRGLSASLLRLLDKMGIDRVHVAGNSMGGALAARLAVDAPDRVRSVVLLAAAGPRGLHPHVQALARSGRNPLLPKNAEEFEVLMEMSFARGGPPLSRAARRHLGHLWSSRHAEHARYFAELEAAALDDGQAYAGGHLQIPALIVYGRQEKIVHLDNSLAFTEYFPRHQLWLLDGAGHAPHVEQTLPVARRMVRFFREHGA